MKGKIEKITPYKTGSGCFIKINGEDLMFYGNTKVKVGEEVEYETNINKFGKPSIKTMQPTSIESFIDTPAKVVNPDNPRSAPIPQTSPIQKDSREGYWAGKEARDIQKEPIITRLSCLSSASMVFEGAQIGHDEEIIALARKMEKFAKGE